MPDREKIYFVNGGQYTKQQMVMNGIEQCLMNVDGAGYETQCADCPYFDPDVSVASCRNELRTDALALLKEQEIVRCKDCKAWKQYDDMNLGECELYPEYNKIGDWFCNFGERKEGR